MNSGIIEHIAQLHGEDGNYVKIEVTKSCVCLSKDGDIVGIPMEDVDAVLNLIQVMRMEMALQ